MIMMKQPLLLLMMMMMMMMMATYPVELIKPTGLGQN